MFIEFTKIKFNNYKAIRASSLVLSERGVVLLQGVNNDKSGSNGAGKSTVASGLLWCLYNQTLAGKETEKEIIPKKKFLSAKDFKKTNGCFVSVEFKRGDISYRVTRHRKHPIHKSAVVVEKMTEAGVYEDKSKCTDKETNIFIEEIVGADYHSFVHSNIFSFSHITPFLLQSDSEKKALILPKYFVEMFKGAYKVCTEEIKNTKIKLNTVADEILSFNIKESEKGGVKATLLKDIEARDTEIKRVKALIAQDKHEKVRVLQEIEADTLQIKNCTQDLQTIELRRVELKEAHISYTQKSGELVSLVNRGVVLERDIGTKKLELESLKAADTEGSVSKLAELTKTADEKGKLYLELEGKKEACEKELEIRRNTLTEVLKTKATLNISYEGFQTELRTLDNEMSALISEKTTLMNQEEAIKTKYYSDKCKTCPASKMKGFFDVTEAKVKALNKVLLEKQERVGTLQKEIKSTYDFIQEVVTLESESNKAVTAIEQGELAEIKQSAFIVSQALHELKNTITAVQQKVDNAGDVLQKIAGIDQAISGMATSLNKINEELEAKKEEDPNQQVNRYADLLNENENERSRKQAEKEQFQIALNNAQLEEREINTRIESKSDTLNVPSNLEDRLDAVVAEIKTIQSDKGTALFNQDKWNTSLELLNFWKVGFSPAGIEGFMLDNLIDAMNKLISKYLSHLSNNTISLTLKPDSKLKTGDVRNKISEKVENEFGGETYRSNSDGEKRTMDIALLFALKYIYEEITGTKYNLLFMDEVFDKLDTPTCSLVVSLINSLESIDTVLTVSHNPDLALEFETIINLVKTNGISTIED